MTPQEALKLLKGTAEEKRQLFDFFVQKAVAEGLEEWEGGMLEAVKKDLFPEKKVVLMSASLTGSGDLR